MSLDPATFEVLRHRLWAINEESVDAIVRVSGSPITVEGNDFNSGLLTAEGDVVVAGIYVLVHAASLGQVCQHIAREYADNPGIRAGDMFITNDTYLGAPHQPDVIVLAPIFDGDRLIAWCGSCVHQNDVGGPVPGSITVGATSIYEEAVPMAPMKIVEGGQLRADVEREVLIRSRTPELNRLDLLGQIAANRVQTERMLELCARYGTETVVEALGELVSTTEAALRARLRSLPDGRWRHRGLLEHDGVADIVYEVGLELTKRGDQLELDFRDSSPQAPALVNTSRAITASYSMAAAMTVLGYELPWTPAAFWRVIEVHTTPGTVVDCRWPAGMSMGVTAAGQEVRTAVNICIDRMLDASDDPEHHRHILASSVSSSATQTIQGHHADGRPFSAMLLDGLPGGAGARLGADGPDAGGYLTSPSGLCTNVETNELHYPLRYLWRRERTDSGGPGRWRGGVGIENAWALHAADGDVVSTVFGHGQQPPTSSGALGGEPGAQHTPVYVRSANVGARANDGQVGLDALGGVLDVPPPKQVGVLRSADIYANLCAGGGGIGDPLERDPADVAWDVAEGLVSVEGAARDYGVVVTATGEVEEAVTTSRRSSLRSARIGGRAPRAPLEAPPAGRRLSRAIGIADGQHHCRRCGHELGPAHENVNEQLWCRRAAVDERAPLASARPGAERFELRRFFCPGCGAQVDVEVSLAHAPILRSAELLDS